MRSRVGSIKRSQKEYLYYRILSTLLMQAAQDDSRLAGAFITRVELSPDKSLCYVFFGDTDEEAFKVKLEVLKLYKGSLRKALADEIKSRYVPDIKFKFDKTLEKQLEVEQLMDKLKD